MWVECLGQEEHGRAWVNFCLCTVWLVYCLEAISRQCTPTEIARQLELTQQNI